MRSVRWLLALLALIALASHFYRGETLHFRLLERSGTLGYDRYLFDFHRFPDGTGRYRGVWSSGCVDRGEKVTRVEVEISHGFRHHQFYVDQMGCTSYNEFIWLATLYGSEECGEQLPGRVLRECRQQAGLPDPTSSST